MCSRDFRSTFLTFFLKRRYCSCEVHVGVASTPLRIGTNGEALYSQATPSIGQVGLQQGELTVYSTEVRRRSRQEVDARRYHLVLWLHSLNACLNWDLLLPSARTGHPSASRPGQCSSVRLRRPLCRCAADSAASGGDSCQRSHLQEHQHVHLRRRWPLFLGP